MKPSTQGSRWGGSRMKPHAVKRWPLVGTALALLLSAQCPQAATFIIADGNVAGLISAITTANSNGQDDTIVLATNGTYTLTARDNGLNGLPTIAPDGGHSLTIQGNGATIQRSSAGGTATFRIFYVNSGGNLTLSGLTLTNGNPGAFHGGAIYNNAETGNARLTINNSTITGCSGDFGGAIFNDGESDPLVFTATLTVTNSTFSSNTGTQYGGAIWSESLGGHTILSVSNSTFSQNTATHDAGAIQHDGSAGSATGNISNCTFSQNSAGGNGGAIGVDGQGGTNGNGSPVSGSATLNVTNCTFAGNSAGSSGAGIAMNGSNDGGTTGNATVNVSSCTFSGNFANVLGDAIYLAQTGAGTTALNIGSTILASADPDFNISISNTNGGSAAVMSQGYNLSDDAAGGGTGTAPGGFLNHSGDIRNTNPLLDPSGLKNNGGLTPTIALQATSPAIDQGKSNTIFAIANDQRGEPRSFDDPNITNASGGDGSDIGAYEADVRTISSNKSGTDFQINFTTILGHTYEVQSRSSLTSGMWTTVNNTVPPPPISGTGGIILVTVPNAFASSPDFYRLHQLP